ncbi:G protein-coupled receptor family protein rhodopsin 7 [Haematobia irritans]|uniref:G protein-coupled receptor family protein rhodopsin 7 n=1 Tax=Haematobia irritans TaxID=7368 RepID=UPI003F50C34C
MTLESVAMSSSNQPNNGVDIKTTALYSYRRKTRRRSRSLENNAVEMTEKTCTQVRPFRLNGIDIRVVLTVMLFSLTAVDGIYTMLNTTSAIITDLPEDMYEGQNYTSSQLLCIPNNVTGCTKYVNSSKNGLIELNESLYPALKAFRGNYDYNLIARVNPFWLQFEPPSDRYYYVMATLYMVIFCIGTSGNGLVIYMFLRCKTLRTSPYLLVLNLAISDFIIVFKCPLAAFNNYMRGPILGDWGCRIYGFIGGFSGTASIGMLTIIAMDRYNVVVNPLNPNRINYSTHYYSFWIAFVWLYALFFSSMPLAEIGLSRYVPEGYFTTCSFDYLDRSMNARIFMFSFFIAAWFVPLNIICYCYFHILKVVIATRENIQSNKNKQKTEMRLALIVLLVILLWFLAWTPYSVVAVCGIFNKDGCLTPTRAMIPALFCKTASCLNPFLYTISHKRFRHELLRIFCKRKPIAQYSITRSSYMTKSSRRQRQYEITGMEPSQYIASIRRRDSKNNVCNNRSFMVKKNVRSRSATDAISSYPRGAILTPRPSMMAEKCMIVKDPQKTKGSPKAIITGSQGSGVFIINERASANSEEEVIFIVSDRVSSIRNSISIPVAAIDTDTNGIMPSDTGPAIKQEPLETSL